MNYPNECNNQDGTADGCLEVSVLSVYDLPWDDTPTILISACGKTVKTGKPISRNRHRNSFRFTKGGSPTTSFNDKLRRSQDSYESMSSLGGDSGSNTPATSNAAALPPPTTTPIHLFAPLKDLFRCSVQIRVIYPQKKKNSPFLETYLDVRDQLMINENKWVVLQLKQTASTSLARAALESSTRQQQSLFSSSATHNTSSTREDFLSDEDFSPPSPSIRLKLMLRGEFRPEISTLLRFCEVYFGVIDRAESQLSFLLQRFSLYRKFILLPFIPVVCGIVVASPLLAAVFMVGLPIFLPFVLTAILISAMICVLTCLVLASTSCGRSQWLPYLTYFIDTPIGQRIVYKTGPRPTVVSLLRRVVPTSRRPNNIYDDDICDDGTLLCDPMTHVWTKLSLSLVIDLIGSATYLLPVIGEVLDVAWAPTQTVVLMAMYDYVSPNLQYISFAEEILPFTDIVPSATIGWLIEYVPLFLNPNVKNGTFLIEQVVSDLTLIDQDET